MKRFDFGRNRVTSIIKSGQRSGHSHHSLVYIVTWALSLTALTTIVDRLLTKPNYFLHDQGLILIQTVEFRNKNLLYKIEYKDSPFCISCKTVNETISLSFELCNVNMKLLSDLLTTSVDLFTILNDNTMKCKRNNK